MNTALHTIVRNLDDTSEENIQALGAVVDSLNQAVNALESLKDSETNHLFKDLELNFPKDGIDFHKATRLYEINLVKQALRQTGGHQAKAAKLLKMRTSTLNSFIKRNNIDH